MVFTSTRGRCPWRTKLGLAWFCELQCREPGLTGHHHREVLTAATAPCPGRLPAGPPRPPILSEGAHSSLGVWQERVQRMRGPSPSYSQGKSAVGVEAEGRPSDLVAQVILRGGPPTHTHERPSPWALLGGGSVLEKEDPRPKGTPRLPMPKGAIQSRGVRSQF